MREVNNTEDLREIQTIEYGILKSVAAFCENNGLRYFLAYGTLIGAVRHKGFIPWDDDVDLLMPRGDFKKFVELYPKLPGGLSQDKRFRLGYLNTIDNYNRFFAKVYDTNTLLNETDRCNDFQEGLFVDVWPLDGTPDNKFLRTLHLRRIRVLNALLTASIKTQYTGHSRAKKLLYSVVTPVCKAFIDPHKLAGRIASISGKEAYRSGKCLINPMAAEQFRYKREWFFSAPRQALFEDTMFSIPSDPHSVLSVQYGDYMQYPQADQRHPHHLFTASIYD